MRFRQWVRGLFLVGGMLIVPFPVDSLDQPLVLCHDQEHCFDEWLVEVDQLDSGSIPSAKSE